MTLPSASFATNVIIHPAEGQVFRIYQAVFDRAPDADGFTAFTNSLQAGVLTPLEITAEFVGSTEFQNTYELRNSTAEAAEAFVQTIYATSADTLLGGTGNDILFGGRGADEFVYDTQTDGQDTILDFTIGADTIDLGSNAAFDSLAEILAVGSQDGLNTVFDFGNGNTLTLENSVLTELTEDEFGLLVG